MSRALMFQGTGSDVGKSLIVAGLCRALARRGVRVLPFKPQNMSNNAAVTADGGEIGRAQDLQARACGSASVVDMNPVLLKPQSEIGAQVVVHGKVCGNAAARDYQRMKPSLMPKVLESFARLKAQADVVLVEGAGSASEVNLRQNDIANMGFAVQTQTPVVMIGDIDRGGVIASLVGTHALLSTPERRLTLGYVINKFRGDVSLFDGAHGAIAAHTGLRSFGVVPYFEGASRLPAEDAMAITRSRATRDTNAGGLGLESRDGARPLRVAVPALSRIANFDDLDPLLAEPGVEVSFVHPGDAIPGDTDLVILSGSKATIADLEYLRAQGWDVDIAAHVRRGGWVLGICAGYQMLGESVRDPMRIEGERTHARGLGLLAVETTLGTRKTLVMRRAREIASARSLSGYEMHMGRTERCPAGGAATVQPWLEIEGKPHGARSRGGRVIGCYLHGLFNDDAFRHAFLDRVRARGERLENFEETVDGALDALAAHLEMHLNVDDLLSAAA